MQQRIMRASSSRSDFSGCPISLAIRGAVEKLKDSGVGSRTRRARNSEFLGLLALLADLALHRYPSEYITMPAVIKIAAPSRRSHNLPETFSSTRHFVNRMKR